MSYRPITDVWLLARSKVPYYGAYPAGFLGRARDLLGVGIHDPVLHVCSGRVRDYPYRGFGPNDRTLDLNASLNPDFIQDAREVFPPYEDDSGEITVDRDWGAVLIDRPYTEEDAAHYAVGASVLPNVHDLLKHGLEVAPRVGMLDYMIPRPPKTARFVACVGVVVGFGNRIRAFTVFERND